MKRLNGALAAGMAILLISLADMATTAMAEISSPWVEGLNSRARLVAGTVGYGNMAGVEITLTDGWKTYWRNPGEGGIPPEFDWRESENIRDVKVRFPAPNRFSDEYGTSMGYKHSVIFPVEFTPIDPMQPQILRLNLDYAVCEALCIPAEASIILEVPGGVSLGPSPRLLLGLSRVPSSSEKAEARVVRVERKDAAPNLMIDVVYPGRPEHADIFAEGPPTWFVPAPQEIDRQVDGDNTIVKYKLDLSGLPGSADIQGELLLFTITGAGRPVEQEWRIGSH